MNESSPTRARAHDAQTCSAEAPSSGCGPRGLVTSSVPESWRAGALLVEAGRCVAGSLVEGHVPRNANAIRKLLGRVMQARLQAALRPDENELELRQLGAAEQSLAALLDQWQADKSHWLEWIIIMLITVDIAVCML